ncbi:hypothetical protein, partial [Sinorhizobium meliloti]
DIQKSPRRSLCFYWNVALGNRMYQRSRLVRQDRIMYRLEERTSEVVSGVALPVTQLFFHAKVVSVA